MSESSIGWTSHTLNPYLWRCQKKSPGCAHCYMMTLARKRHQNPDGPFGTRWPAALRELERMPAGAVAFVNSMSDTYFEEASDRDVHQVHNMALSRPDVTFLVLTKRPERAFYMGPMLAWPDNLWLGVSVEAGDYLWRIDYALATPARHVFISAEPLLADIGVRMRDYLNPRAYSFRKTDVPWPVFHAGRWRAVSWVICGGESGPDRRPFEKRWASSIMHSCQEFSVPFFFKQGSRFYPGLDRDLDGRTWDEVPEAFGWVPEHAPVQVAAAPSPPVQLALFGGKA